MKVRNDKVIHHSGDLAPVATVAMSIDEQAMAHIMSVLTDLYSDPALAVIREYSTNAYDSHRAAGNTAPIEIELPSQLRPTFVVRDHGVGMSEQTISEQFSKYGFSSKRESNNEVGILGLGCKSGLTYTNQFTLVSVKDGIKCTVLITRDDHGVGVLQIVNVVETSEPNGVEIQIPVSNAKNFSDKAIDFFRFWEKGTVLVNGEPPLSIFDDPAVLTLDEDVIVVKQRGYGRPAYVGSPINCDYVVMGNIAYPCDKRISSGSVAGYNNVVARIEVGEIDFTPSREALHYSKHTTKTLEAVNQFVKGNLQRHAQQEVDKKKNRWDAARESLRWKDILPGSGSLTFNGEKIPSSIDIEGWEWGPRSYSGKASKSTRITIQTAMNDSEDGRKTILVRNHPKRSMDQALKDALTTKYGDKLGQVFAICGDLPKPEQEPWLTGCPQEEYSVIRPRATRQARGSGPAIEIFKWMVYNPNTHTFTETDQPLTAKRVCYILRTDPEIAGVYHTRDSFRRLTAEFITRLNDEKNLEKIEFAVVRKPKLEQFLQLHPQAQTFGEFVQSLLTEIDAKLSDDALEWGQTPHDLRAFNANDVLDPETAAIIRRIQVCMGEDMQKLHKQRKEVINAAHQFARITLTGRQGKSDILTKLEVWRKNYPLAQRMIGDKAAHLEYMNAVYSYRSQQGKKVG
jgi:hypothetical protein